MTTSGLGHQIPPELVETLQAELPDISEEVVRTISAEVPEYVRPLSGAFGRGVRNGVTQALLRFLALVRDEGADPALSSVYVELGQQEFRAGRTLDALQAAYRVGARVTWRRIAELSVAAGPAPELLARLAETLFAYIDELSAESIEGYAQAQSELAGERERRRRELVEALLRPCADAAEVARLSTEAGWNPPRTAAALACPAGDAPRIAHRLGSAHLHARIEGDGCVVVPDAAGPGRLDALRLAVGEHPAALGPDAALERLWDSWNLARGTLQVNPAPGLHAADEHLGDLVLLAAAPVVRRIAECRLSGLEELTVLARERTVRTALAYLQHRGNAQAMARALHVHPQTVRYRIARVREVFGDQLDVPEARFELEAALRQASKSFLTDRSPGSEAAAR